VRNASRLFNYDLRSHHVSWNNQVIALVDSSNKGVEVGMATSRDRVDYSGDGISEGKVTEGRKGPGAYGAGLRVLSYSGDRAAYYSNR
jgi:hypothetical protein